MNPSGRFAALAALGLLAVSGGAVPLAAGQAVAGRVLDDSGRAVAGATVRLTDADLIPDEAAGTLTIRLHHLTNRASDEAARFLAENLNASETVYPDTNLRLVYKMVSDGNPPDQES